mmetsp:Transcript_2460/g.5178  ORF Transcript_2460/g.5178 Transcript_2460/m.5178 type:complete len:90 (-) Transcript_2460:26-295(-)
MLSQFTHDDEKPEKRSRFGEASLERWEPLPRETLNHVKIPCSNVLLRCNPNSSLIALSAFAGLRHLLGHRPSGRPDPPVCCPRYMYSSI